MRKKAGGEGEDELAKLASVADEEGDPSGGGRAEIWHEPRPEGGVSGVPAEADSEWARRTVEEQLSAAGAAAQAADRVVGVSEFPRRENVWGDVQSRRLSVDRR